MYRFPYLHERVNLDDNVVRVCGVDVRSGAWSGEKMGRTEQLSWSVNTLVRCSVATAT